LIDYFLFDGLAPGIAGQQADEDDGRHRRQYKNKRKLERQFHDVLLSNTFSKNF
jgi:hypothetical protein